MANLSLHPNIIKLEAKTADDLELQINSINAAYSIVSIYGMNNRHYAFLSMHQGVKKKVVRSKVRTSLSKKEKVKL